MTYHNPLIDDRRARWTRPCLNIRYETHRLDHCGRVMSPAAIRGSCDAKEVAPEERVGDELHEEHRGMRRNGRDGEDEQLVNIVPSSCLTECLGEINGVDRREGDY